MRDERSLRIASLFLSLRRIRSSKVECGPEDEVEPLSFPYHFVQLLSAGLSCSPNTYLCARRRRCLITQIEVGIRSFAVGEGRKGERMIREIFSHEG